MHHSTEASKPSVAAVAGLALGGGLELAMVCYDPQRSLFVVCGPYMC